MTGQDRCVCVSVCVYVCLHARMFQFGKVYNMYLANNLN